MTFESFGLAEKIVSAIFESLFMKLATKPSTALVDVESPMPFSYLNGANIYYVGFLHA